MPDVTPPQQERTPQSDAEKTMSRRELLRKAGWVVPAVVAIPLMPGTAHGTGKHHYASGGKPHFPPPGKSGDDWKWSHGPKYSGGPKYSHADWKREKHKLFDWLKGLFDWWGKKSGWG